VTPRFLKIKSKATKISPTNSGILLGSFFSNTEGLTLDESLITQEKDRARIDELKALGRDITADCEEFRFHLAAEKIYHYIWHQFADIIIEESKAILTTENEQKVSRQHTLLLILKTSITLLHPFMPFITEEIWSHFPKKQNNLLMIESWPTGGEVATAKNAER
jgi:valyl-tRNA synthetase